MALHGALDAAMAFPPRCDLNWYQRFLTVNSAAIGVEQALDSAGIAELLPDWQERQRRSALEDDLKALGLPLTPRQTVSIEADPAAMLGWAYVLEGSRLGAQFILKFVETTATAEIRAATRFLRHGQDMGFWLSFLEVLQSSNLDEGGSVRAGNAAKDCFLYFLQSATAAPLSE